MFYENFSHRHVKFLGDECKSVVVQHVSKLGWAGKSDIEWIPIAISKGGPSSLAIETTELGK